MIRGSFVSAEVTAPGSHDVWDEDHADLPEMRLGVVTDVGVGGAIRVAWLYTHADHPRLPQYGYSVSNHFQAVAAGHWARWGKTVDIAGCVLLDEGSYRAVACRTFVRALDAIWTLPAHLVPSLDDWSYVVVGEQPAPQPGRDHWRTVFAVARIRSNELGRRVASY